jgi:ribosome biogenesis GTPase
MNKLIGGIFIGVLSGRIIKGVGGLYFVRTPDGVYACQARGLFRKQRKTPLVGDFVEILEIDEAKKTGYLQKLLDRKNELIRPRIANVDQAIVVFAAASPDFNMDLLDRFITLIEKQGLDSVICINKSDLAAEGFEESIKAVYSRVGYPVIFVSARTNTGLDALKKVVADKVSVVAGPSGVGKTSLMNLLFPGLSLETGEISRKIERGKHTTRHTEFLPLTDGGFIADTPGFTTLDLEGVAARELPGLFREFAPFFGRCRFADCAHLSEPDCAVKAAVGQAVSASRYESYQNFHKIIRSGSML